MFHIFIIVGESGSGKTTLQKNLENCKCFNIVKGSTTREMREWDGEVQGDPYNFISKKNFQNKIATGEMIEYVILYGDYYGVGEKEFDTNKINIVVLEPNGIQPIKEYFGEENVTTVYICLSEEERKKRMTIRGDSKDRIAKRLKADMEVFKGFYKISDYKIDSTSKEEDFQEMMGIIKETILEKRNSNVR